MRAFEHESRRAAAALLAFALCACGADDTGTDANSPAALGGGGAGMGGAGMGAGAAGLATGASGTGTGAGGAGGSSRAGAGGAAMGMAGAAPSGRGGGPAPGGMGGTMPMDGVDPSAIVLEAIAANGAIGLDWSRVKDATGYKLYFANAPGVTPQSGQAIMVTEPAYVHRGLTNGMPYHYVVAAVLASGDGPPSMEANATPAGEWVLEQLGTGDFDDIVTGARVPRVPVEQRVQILLYPEGYTAADLPIFHAEATHAAGNNDVDRWIAQVFALDPYSRFKEAFVVWYLPRASGAHPGEGDTAFDLGVGDGSVSDPAPVAAPLWSTLDGEGTDAFPFAPGTAAPNNLVAAFMVFDAMRMRSGWSGLTTTLRNPANQNQRIGAAFGLGHPHEFTHAFGRLADEYMETTNMNRGGMSETSNVTGSNMCTTLPWAHLLEGRGINTTAGLVGAFGSAELGFHSELNCQMNGTHDNGQFWCEEGDERYTTLTLRPDRFCNFCREMIAFRVFERSAVLSGMDAFAKWKSDYRGKFFERFGFAVPQGAIPQTLECNRNDTPKPVYEACVP